MILSASPVPQRTHSLGDHAAISLAQSSQPSGQLQQTAELQSADSLTHSCPMLEACTQQPLPATGIMRDWFGGF